MSTEPWDMICVGSGISALTYAAAIMQRDPSMRVLVLEQHSVPGGYSSEFHRPKQQSRFDCSMHKLTGMGETGNLRRLFRDLGLEKEMQLHFSPAWFETAGQPSLVLESDPDLTLHALVRAFPNQEAGLRQFFEEVTVHGYNSYMQFEIMQGRFEPNFKQLRHAHKHFKHLTVRDALRERFSDQHLVELLSAPSIYVGTFPEQCSYLYYLHVVYASLHQRSAYLSGGSQFLSDLLVRQIESRGGCVLLNVTVECVLVDDAELSARGVVTDHGEFRSRTVLINAAPHYALTELFKPRPELETCITNVKHQVPANATTTLYLVLDCAPEECGLRSAETMVLAADSENAHALRTQVRLEPTNADLAERAYWEFSTFEVTNYHTLDPSGGRVVVVNALDDIRHWPIRKTPEYRAKKKRATVMLLRRLIEQFPLLESHIQYSELSSPRTYQRYTNNTAGSGYGALVSPHAVPTLLNHRFPIDGVRFLSAWVSGSGYEAVIGYSWMMAMSAPVAAVSKTNSL